MTDFKSTAADSIWLATYAHNTLQPILDAGAVPGAQLYLKVSLHFGGDYPGADVVVHYRSPEGHHKILGTSYCATKDSVDKLAAELTETLAKPVTA